MLLAKLYRHYNDPALYSGFSFERIVVALPPTRDHPVHPGARQSWWYTSFVSFVILAMAALLVGDSGPATAHSLAREIERHYARTSTLQAVFLERVLQDGGVRVETGTVYFRRPGKMRWEYESPDQKLFLVDGKHVWLYVPADRTASRAPVKQSSDLRTPLALLTGKVHLSQLCGKIEVADLSAAGSAGGGSSERPVSSNNVVLRCWPHKGAEQESFREILLEVDPQYRLVRILVREPGNVETEFRFGRWQENIPLPEAKFHFEPPPGVAIVDEAELVGSAR
jgi:outer membrane lipoprotein carrier protein